jgi:hypothetical protein
MFIIASDIVINTDNVSAIFVNDKGHLQFEVPDGALTLGNIPDNALQQVAIAVTEHKPFLEMEDATLVIEKEDNNDVGSDIE